MIRAVAATVMTITTTAIVQYYIHIYIYVHMYWPVRLLGLGLAFKAFRSTSRCLYVLMRAKAPEPQSPTREDIWGLGLRA